MSSDTLARFFGVAGAAAVGAWLLVRAIRQYALRAQMVDRPGPRTSHSQPTPRGGGLGVVAMIVGIGMVAAWRAGVDWRLALALTGLMSVAVVGWVDDVRSLSVPLRLAAHVLAAALLLPLATSLAAGCWYAGGVGLLWWIFWGVSSINVINFMDGIDGLIASQMMILGVHFVLLSATDVEAIWFAAALTGASAGFLAWNWSPARIFMGDSGSGALGLAAVVGGLLVIRAGAGVVVAFLPLCPLFLDATATLFRRLRRGERITNAHRSHLYQRLANGGWGHARVSLVYGAAALGALPVAALGPAARPVGIGGYFVVVLIVGVWFEHLPP